MPPMNDRLADLGDDVPAWARDHDRDATNDIEMGYISKSTKKNPDDFDWQEEEPEEEPASSSDKGAMDAFFRDVDSIKEDIEVIEKVTKRIGEINEESVLSVSEAREKELSQEMQPLIAATNKRAKKTKNLLSVLKDENKGLKKKLSVSDMR
jgi:t-SNARE complex subunit (syntaxin)